MRWWLRWYLFKRRRRKLEYWAFLVCDPEWQRIREENDTLGVW